MVGKMDQLKWPVILLQCLVSRHHVNGLVRTFEGLTTSNVDHGTAVQGTQCPCVWCGQLGLGRHLLFAVQFAHQHKCWLDHSVEIQAPEDEFQTWSSIGSSQFHDSGLCTFERGFPPLLEMEDESFNHAEADDGTIL